MLLRQTRAEGVARVWPKLMKKYPDASRMAKANRRELRGLIKILGFGTMRSDALKIASKWLVEEHDGRVPENFQALIRIPHIGAYSANAILSFAFGQKVEIVDGNVLRFFSRYYGLKIKPDIRRNPEVVKRARQSLPKERRKVAPHNYGILDFTAEICRPVSPRCNICPIISSCRLGKELTKEPNKSRRLRLKREL